MKYIYWFIYLYEMTYVNSEYNYDNEVPKASCIFVSGTVNIFDSLLPSLYVYTYVYCFVF